MFGRLHAIRSLSGKLLAGAALAAMFVVAGCGGSSSTGGGSTPGATNTPSSLTACKVTSADLTPSSTGSGTATGASLSGTLAVDGSSALQPLLKQAAAEFDKANTTMTTVNAGGSGQGLKDVEAGAVEIGMSDVFAQEKDSTPPKYTNLTDHQVAVVIFTLIVNNDLASSVQNLTSAQILQIFTGQVANWQSIGGPNEAVTVITRTASSGTRATFKKWVLGGASETSTGTLDNTGAVVAAVKSTPGAIGYVTDGFAVKNSADVSPICIDGAKPTLTDVNSGNYKFWNIEHAYTKGPAAGLAKSFLQYVVGPQVQMNDVLALGYFPISQVGAAQITAHTPSGAPTPESLG
jgi:phosphate transport system substrate-binding protein